MSNKLLLSSALLFSTVAGFSQTAARTYAITGKTNNIFYWADIKEVDIKTGKVINTVYDNGKTNAVINYADKDQKVEGAAANPTGFGVAACALDAVHNRLYFAPMHFSEIRYLDLSKPNATFTIVKTNVVESKEQYQTEDKHLTRMVIASDGNGYAITNDGKHLIRFSTAAKSAKVQDLGPLVNAASNNKFSIHEKETGWGGDVVADAFGNLVVITARHEVDSINVNSRVATHMATIFGIPETFTTNGAAVDEDGDLVVSSANVLEGLYKVSVKDFTASKIANGTSFNASDLANGRFLSQKKFDLLSQNNVNFADEKATAKVFPNPVFGKSFNLLTSGNLSGVHTVVISDLSGKVLQSTSINFTQGNKTQQVSFVKKMTKGSYIVRVYNASKSLVLNDKMIVQ